VIKSNYASIPVYRVVKLIKILEGQTIKTTEMIDEIAILKKLIRFDEP
jgi:hypothetical protein